MSDIRAAVKEVEGQIETRMRFLQALAFLESLGKTIGIHLVAQDISGRKVKSAKVSHHKKAAQPAKRKLSTAGRKAIAAAAKKRWAKVHAAQRAAKKKKAAK
jgi:hypothetical protein